MVPMKSMFLSRYTSTGAMGLLALLAVASFSLESVHAAVSASSSLQLPSAAVHQTDRQSDSDSDSAFHPKLRAEKEKRRKRLLQTARDMDIDMAVREHQKPSRSLQNEDEDEDEDEGEDQVQDNDNGNEDGYDAYSSGYSGYEAYGAYSAYSGYYNGSNETENKLTFSGTGFGEKWNKFFKSMKSWGSNMSNHSSSGTDESTSTSVQDSSSSSAGDNSEYAENLEASGYGHYTNDYWNQGNNSYSSGTSANWEDYQGMQNENVGFGMTNYNFMYTGCNNVEVGSDEGTGKPQYIRYATFRLCPASTCSDNTFRGCNSNYGEYVVGMDDFLQTMVEFNNERMTGFCEYCQECADIEAFNVFFATISGKKKAAVTKAQNHYSDWYQYYNGGNYDSNSAQKKYYKLLIRSNTSTSTSSSSSSYNSQSSHGYSSANTDAWQSLQQGAGTWYGRPVVNGYYDTNGQFNAAWGYFSGYDGSFISLQDTSITWDPSTYGQFSESWDEDWLAGGAMLGQCKYKYTEACRDEYESCREFLADDDYENYETYEEQSTGATAASSLKEYLGCSAVDMDKYAYLQQQRQQYEKNVREQQQGYYEQAVECEEGDGNCAQGQQEDYDQLYIGPHCGDNSLGISLAVFTDEYCSSYASDLTVEEVLGTSIKEDEINFFPQQCIACEAEVWYEGEEVEGAEDGINPLCSILYERAEKCNRHMKKGNVYNFGSSQSNSQYQGQNEEENENEEQSQFGSEQEACHFIDALSPRNPDKLSRGMLIGLILIAASAVVMAGLACRLRRKVAKSTERKSGGALWYPSKSGVAPMALLSKPFSEWAPNKSIAPTNAMWTPRKSASPDKSIAPTNAMWTPRKSASPHNSNSPTNAIWTSRKSASPTSNALDESGVIGFGFDVHSSRVRVVPSLAREPLMQDENDLMPGENETLGRADAPDVNLETGWVESAKEKIDRIEAEMLRYAEETATIISNLSTPASRNFRSNSKEEQETKAGTSYTEL